MITNYVLYLTTLPKQEAIKQFLIFCGFFIILLAICGLLKYLKLKFMDKNKNSIIQRFLKRL